MRCHAPLYSNPYYNYTRSSLPRANVPTRSTSYATTAVAALWPTNGRDAPITPARAAATVRSPPFFRKPLNWISDYSFYFYIAESEVVTRRRRGVWSDGCDWLITIDLTDGMGWEWCHLRVRVGAMDCGVLSRCYWSSRGWWVDGQQLLDRTVVLTGGGFDGTGEFGMMRNL